MLSSSLAVWVIHSGRYDAASGSTGALLIGGCSAAWAVLVAACSSPVISTSWFGSDGTDAEASVVAGVSLAAGASVSIGSSLIGTGSPAVGKRSFERVTEGMSTCIRHAHPEAQLRKVLQRH